MKYDTKMVITETFVSLGSFLLVGTNILIWLYFFGVLE